MVIHGSYEGNNGSYYDEWYIQPFKDASLMAIEDAGHSIAHNSYFSSLHNSLEQMGYTVIEEHYDDNEPYDGKDFLFYLSSSSIFTIMTHGAPTQIQMSNGTTVHMLDVMEMVPNCLSDLELVILASCYTAQEYYGSTPPRSFAESLFAQGAQNVIGFKREVWCEHVIPWMKNYFSALELGHAYEDELVKADESMDATIVPLEIIDGTPIYSTSALYRKYLNQ